MERKEGKAAQSLSEKFERSVNLRKKAAETTSAKAEAEATTKSYLYVQIFAPDQICSWHLLDLNNGEALDMNWKMNYSYTPAVVSVNSDIYILGGFISTAEDGTELYADDVYRIEAGLGERARDVPVSVLPPMPRKQPILKCVALDGKIYLFPVLSEHLLGLTNAELDPSPEKVVLEVFDPTLGEWIHYTRSMVKLPDCLIDIDPAFPVLADSHNHRILIYYPTQGLYAFYPSTNNWMCLGTQKLSWVYNFVYSTVVDNVLYYCNRSADIRGGLKALDLDNDLEPFKMLWPEEGVDYKFDYDSIWFPVDLGNGTVCLVTQATEWVEHDPLVNHPYSDTMPDTMPSARGPKYSIKHWVKGMVLEVTGKKPPPENHPDKRSRLTVNHASRISYELAHLVSPSGALMNNLVAVAPSRWPWYWTETDLDGDGDGDGTETGRN